MKRSGTLGAIVLVLVLFVAGPAVAQTVTIETSKGDIVVELDAKAAPITVANFMEYVKAGFFADTVFHRVIKGFMIQGGGMTADMNEKTTRAPIKLESNNGLKNARGTIAMARTNVPDSATSQFFINHKDNAMLNSKGGADGYAVFGKVVKGMEVVDAIAEVPTTSRAGHRDVPAEPVTIKAVRVMEEKRAAPAKAPTKAR